MYIKPYRESAKSRSARVRARDGIFLQKRVPAVRPQTRGRESPGACSHAMNQRVS